MTTATVALTVVDCLLALGFTLRLTRLVVLDDLGRWLLREPAQKWADSHEPTIDGIPAWKAVASGRMHATPTPQPGWRSKLVSGLTCPFCVGFWLAALVVASLLIAGGPGAPMAPDGAVTLATAWRTVAALFSLNWLAAHIGARAGDAGYAED